MNGPFTSPRLRGEVDRSEARSGEGDSRHDALDQERPSPHPSPRKRGERETTEPAADDDDKRIGIKPPTTQRRIARQNGAENWKRLRLP